MKGARAPFPHVCDYRHGGGRHEGSEAELPVPRSPSARALGGKAPGARSPPQAALQIVLWKLFSLVGNGEDVVILGVLLT